MSGPAAGGRTGSRTVARRDERVGVALTLTAAIGYGAVPVVAKAGFASGLAIGPLVGLRSLLAGLLLGCVALALDGRAGVRAIARDRWTLVLAVVFGLHVLGFLVGVREVGAAVTALVFYCYPAVVALGERALYGRALGRRLQLALVANFTGLVLLVGGSLRLGWGLLAVAFATVAYAVYILLAMRSGQTRFPAASCAATTLLGGVLFVVLEALDGGVAVPHGGGAWGAFAGLGLAMGIGLPSLLAGVARLGAVRAAILSAIEPLVTVLLAVTLLGERLTPGVVAGGALITLAATWACVTSAVRAEV
jgi:drug/metabolite transporter (DMT)-like permease